MPNIRSAAQSLEQDAIIDLFTLDTSSVGGPILHFVQGDNPLGKIKFNNIEYEAIDIEFDGLETTGVGALPSPTIKISNTDGVIQAILNTFGDILGCTLYRYRTFRRFLDDGSEPDPTAVYGPDTFRFERKTSENKVAIEWELSAAIDQEGKQLPGRQVIRDTCLWRYRVWNATTGKFDYSKAQCPYTGSRYFDINDNEVSDPALDQPSRRLNCCELRFNTNPDGSKKGAPLPFGGFPGVARVRE